LVCHHTNTYVTDEFVLFTVLGRAVKPRGDIEQTRHAIVWWKNLDRKEHFGATETHFSNVQWFD
jgi:hypothetical protein